MRTIPETLTHFELDVDDENHPAAHFGKPVVTRT